MPKGQQTFKHQQFSVPALPKAWYQKVQDFKAGLGLDDRQVVILGLWALCEIGDKTPGRVNEAALSVRERYPSKKKPGDPLFAKPAPVEGGTAVAAPVTPESLPPDDNGDQAHVAE